MTPLPLCPRCPCGLGEKLDQAFRQPPGGPSVFATGRLQHGGGTEVVADLDGEAQRALGDGPPGLPFVKTERIAVDPHRRDVQSAAQGNLRRAALHLQGNKSDPGLLQM
jgi:hypothetical protein